MINAIIAQALRHRYIVLALAFVLGGASFWAVKHTPLDALPDVSPVQAIIEITWEGQTPRIMEAQAAYPVVTQLLSVPNVQTVRAMSGYGSALVFILFEEGTDIYWARSRITEQLSLLQSKLPFVSLALGPDASGVGWVYEYALSSKDKNLQELRTLQEYHIKRALQTLQGVSDVATVGGFIPNLQLTLSQEAMMRFDLSITQIMEAIKKNNQSTSAGLVTQNGYEWMVQAQGYIEDVKTLSNVSLGFYAGVPIYLKDIGRVEFLPLSRRGVADLNGEGEVIGGIVMSRYGANAYEVISRVKAKLATLTDDTITVHTVYDRSQLIEASLATLMRTLVEEILIVAFIIGLFLSHFRSTLVVIIVLPLTVGATFLCMKLFGISSNIMSLGGIAIAIGTMIDATIIMIESAHKELSANPNNRLQAIQKASQKVGPPIFFALILVVVSFLPIFALQGEEGLLFSPLAFTKSFAMGVGALLSITLVPVLIFFLVKGTIAPEETHRLTSFLSHHYRRWLEWVLRYRRWVLGVTLAFFLASIGVLGSLKWEFMPSFNEQSVMYMPVVPYGISIQEAKALLQKTNAIIKTFPEVKTVFGKAGRADTPTDSAPLGMLETIITFHEHALWRDGMTHEKLLKEMDAALSIDGVANAWTYPIRGRIDMLLTGVRTPLGIKLYGQDTATLERLSTHIVEKLQAISHTQSVFADQSNTGYFLNITPKPKALARYNLTQAYVQTHIQALLGGMTLDTSIQGMYRYPISVRLDSSMRNSLEHIQEQMIKTPFGYVPLKAVCDINYAHDSAVIKTENGQYVSYVYITPSINAVSYQAIASQALLAVTLPTGYHLEWTGASQQLERAKQTLLWIIPLVLALIVFSIYAALGSMRLTMLVVMTLPLALMGGVFYLWILDFALSIAVIVGFLALLGIAAETAIVMIIYIQDAMSSSYDSQDALISGCTKRLRPKLMTMLSIIAALVPVMLLDSVGSEIMQKIAAPMLGGILSSTLVTLFLIPILYRMLDKKIPPRA